MQVIFDFLDIKNAPLSPELPHSNKSQYPRAQWVTKATATLRKTPFLAPLIKNILPKSVREKAVCSIQSLNAKTFEISDADRQWIKNELQVDIDHMNIFLRQHNPSISFYQDLPQ